MTEHTLSCAAGCGRDVLDIDAASAAGLEPTAHPKPLALPDVHAGIAGGEP